MTEFLPLDATVSFPPSPAFLVASSDPVSRVKRVVRAILKACRIIVVCGAGISVGAGIPDFRSSGGLFQSLKKDHPRLISGKDLFDVSTLRSEDTIPLFYQMIARLSQLSEAAEPTTFHRLLHVLDDRRHLLRVYTQNIDALEEKAGLTFGVPRAKSTEIGRGPHDRKALVHDAPVNVAQPTEPSTNQPPSLPTDTPSPPAETPKCIPLHGSLQLMHCIACTHSYPLPNYIDSLISGIPPSCPQCTALEQTRQLIGKRSRGIGKLRPSVVLYNEDHKDGEAVGSVVQKDLTRRSRGKGRGGVDLLLVVGTSLHVPGAKRMVREFSKAVQSQCVTTNASPSLLADQTMVSAQGEATVTPPHRSTGNDGEAPVRTIYLNLEFPIPAREWEGVFDVWVCGDAQAFAKMVHEELEKDKGVKEAVKERKRKREETIAENTGEKRLSGRRDEFMV